MARLIDANALIKKWENVHSKDMSFAMAVIGAINDVKKAPTVDAVPVIRCKDCKYYREDGGCWHEWDNDRQIYYQSVINEPNPDDYCSYAERKNDRLR